MPLLYGLTQVELALSRPSSLTRGLTLVDPEPTSVLTFWPIEVVAKTPASHDDRGLRCALTRPSRDAGEGRANVKRPHPSPEGG